jgi:hypothetical protein
MRPAAAPLAVLAALSIAREARADKDELTVAIEPGYATVTDPSGARLHGGGGTATLLYGLDNVAWLTASAGAFGFAPSGKVLIEGFGGVTAAFDVLRVVPFAELALGVTARSGGTVEPALRLGLGADYLLSPRFSLGLVARWHPLFGGSAVESLWTAGFRIGIHAEL